MRYPLTQTAIAAAFVMVATMLPSTVTHAASGAGGDDTASASASSTLNDATAAQESAAAKKGHAHRGTKPKDNTAQAPDGTAVGH